jgi:polyvinyl alcohol dehydrogenase (cytochrome)
LIGSAVLLLAAAAGLALAADPGSPPKAFHDAYKPPTYALDPAVARRGAEIYAGVCAACHDQGLNRAPQRYMIALMTPESIHRALTEGVMRGQAQAANLGEADVDAVAQYVSGRPMGASIRPPLMCAPGVSPFDVGEPPVFAGWGLSPGSTHAIPTRVAGIDRGNVGSLTLKWALAFPNAIRARSQPTLAGGAIFVGSHDGTVFALDRETGCARWTFAAPAEVRTGIVVSPWRAGDTAARPLVYFGDIIGDVFAIDARTGALVWTARPDPHPNATLTAAPVLSNGRLYVAVSSLEEGRASNAAYPCCTFRGSVVAYRAASGAKLWQTYMTDPPIERGVTAAGVKIYGPSGVALWGSPVVDEKRGRLFIATGDNYSTPATRTSDAFVALSLATGKIAWAYQARQSDAWNGSCDGVDKSNCPAENGPDYDFGAGAILAHASNGRDYLIAGAKSGMLFAVDPDTGRLVWKQRVGRGGVVAGIHFGIAAQGDSVFAPVSDVPDGRAYDIPARPGLYALDIKTGRFLWKAPAADVCGGKSFCHPGYGGAITATPQLVFAGANDGHLRAYDAADGRVLWDTDTMRDYPAVNGATARGGSMGGGAAPIAYKGLLIMNSGYGFVGETPGNALLVFAVR